MSVTGGFVVCVKRPMNELPKWMSWNNVTVWSATTPFAWSGAFVNASLRFTSFQSIQRHSPLAQSAMQTTEIDWLDIGGEEELRVYKEFPHGSKVKKN
ncbi:hypothetical protein AVEN_138148-1 [Araneus ventricosus]|uniref:Uncharacterized protein n=1 Tax=Araneus ventricosus TaxID=182803 RepID=A0A4Y2F8V3_ARAVE|nr:hypothetical protein AVEN_138148-1 [Araneus ventricosus]